ncbi:LysR family transcriptional regulator [Burkholderia gladioli]|uniref:LysR family transcriptional regulator n=1 Tax=Burkholderia gladioli TaxID=28095 RepID=UPI00264D0660|nr:LysR family transcriptional regulator [Burkholderia gladioli]MDN7752946.1 LysR family transcriptional regulator [Burkholderia gladioli]
MIRELKTFLSVVRYGTFARAGAQVGLTQSAVSAQVQRLEDELGFTLFDRTGRSATLNAAGRRTVERAEELLAVYARLANEGAAEPDTGLLRIGAIASAQTSLLVQAIALFRERAPGWRVRVMPGVSLNLLAQVDSGEVDGAVLIKPPFALPAELQWRALVREPFTLLVPRAQRNGDWRALLKSEPFIRYDRNSFGGRIVERWLRKMRLNVQDVVELDELQAIVELVARGVGVALVPQAAALRIPRTAVALPLDGDPPSREIGYVERTAGERPAAAATFAACVAAAAEAAEAAQAGKAAEVR